MIDLAEILVHDVLVFLIAILGALKEAPGGEDRYGLPRGMLLALDRVRGILLLQSRNLLSDVHHIVAVWYEWLTTANLIHLKDAACN